ncbi:siderophore-interacting protein [Sulfitobacter sp. M22]|jgi:NADPH-dependent ferric siderophore reductase|uniref:siderophore-interacting protein n=1 Tax=Sulfitobacter sp. M22 TaxID=2675332 RepID=UPI001F8998AC|nr:siderophore-interacting protein [Sulfitobacter sp. M22]MCF7728411.1 siderophore-interacting protein [Sulfitobacter sp. M22]|tara:strand:- start:3053 stop:3898 length:846 start_codon:yes stop_codon:yes gene_type:complete
MRGFHHHDSQKESTPERRPRRVRHELRFRLLEVRNAERLTPHMMRITLGGGDLEGFHSPGFDDHIKLFFPAPGEEAPPRPDLSERGVSFPAGQVHPAVRDFTPRHHDPVAGTLQIDFALHETGPASEWARQARPGQKLGIGGPRGSFILPMDFDWHLLIGDETALPAIARRLEELPADARVIVLAEVDGEADELTFGTQAAATVHWVHRGAAPSGTAPLVEALNTVAFPEGHYYAWIACESSSAKCLRQALIAEHGANPKWIRASGYWRRGTAGVHDSFDE